MHVILITLATAAAIALIHFSYVDFRFRYRDGILWFWLLNPAPPLMWVARATVIIAILMALAIGLVGATKTYAYAIVAVMVLNIVSMILLEVLEPH